MPPKKKALQTEENHIITEEPIVEETMEAPKPKKKRELSEAQKANFAKLQAANKVRYEARREAKVASGEPIKEKGSKNVNEEILEDKEAYIQKEITKKKTQVRNVKKQIEQVESDEESEVQIIKKQKKKKKPKIVIEQDSSSEEEEIVISRRRRNKKHVVAQQVPPPSKPIDIPDRDEKKEDKQETGPIEKEKKEKKVPELKEYTHLQILKGLGL